MRINLEYNQPAPKEGETQLSNQELSEHYISLAVTNVHKEGLEGQERRIYGRIQRKLTDAIEGKVDTIELEEAEKDMLKKSFRTAKFPAFLSKYIVILEDEIESL